MNRFKILTACTLAFVGATLSFQASAGDKATGILPDDQDPLVHIAVAVQCGSLPGETVEYCEEQARTLSNLPSNRNKIIKLKLDRPGQKTIEKYFKNGTECKDSAGLPDANCSNVPDKPAPEPKKCDTADKRSALENVGIATRTPSVAGRAVVVPGSGRGIGGGDVSSSCIGELNL